MFFIAKDTKGQEQNYLGCTAPRWERRSGFQNCGHRPCAHELSYICQVFFRGRTDCDKEKGHPLKAHLGSSLAIHKRDWGGPGFPNCGRCTPGSACR